MGTRRLILLLLALAACMGFAQEKPSPSPEASPSPASSPYASPAASPSAEPDLLTSTLALDISTAGLHELAAWCRSLGLSETGAMGELRARLYQHYGVKPPEGGPEAERKIEIKSAREAEYFTVEEDDQSMVRLSGGVVLLMVDAKRSWTHEIKAREITFNQSLNLLSARGDIRYTLKKPEGEELFFGEALDVDLSTWTGDFLDGRIIRASTGSGLEKQFTFSAKAIAKGEGDLSVFSDAVISSCPETKAPHYSIRATNAWILGKSEWALSNAVLYVGEIPLLYLPIFYYTGEEIVFHPVFGTKDREGYFVQSTLYLLGEKKASTETISLLKLNAQTQGIEKKLTGVYLLSTDKKKAKATPDILKLMLDAYTNLGVMAGMEASFSSDKKLPTVSLSAIAAFTRNVYALSDGSVKYSPFIAANGWESRWNGSSFLGLSLPLRYGADLGASYQLSEANLSLSLAFPFYSDPYLKSEFNRRSEDMKWFSFLEDSTAANAGAAPTILSSLEMKAEGNYAPDLGMLKPYLNSAKIANLRTKLNFTTKQTKVEGENGGFATLNDSDPNRFFYAPEQWTIVDGSLPLSGTIFSYPAAAKKSAPKKGAAPGKGAAEPEEESLPQPRSPWYEEGKGTASGDGGGGAGGPSAPEAAGEPDFRLKKASIATTAPTVRAPFSFSLGYDANPSATVERSFATSPWNSGADVDWATLFERRLLRVSGSVTARAAVYGALASTQASLTYVGQSQEHYAFTEATGTGGSPLLSESSKASYLKSDYQALQDKLSGSFSLSSNPLQDFPLFSGSLASYRIDCILRNVSFQSVDAATSLPVYQTTDLGWNKESVTGHSLSATLGLLPAGWAQSLTLSATLPPLSQSYSATLNLKAWDGTASATSRLYYSDTLSLWKYDDLKVTGGYSFGGKASLSDSFVYNISDNHPASNALSLKLWDFTAALNHSWSRDQKINASRAWEEFGELSFQPASLTASYASSIPAIAAWKDRISLKPSVSSALNINFQRYSNSTFSFNLSTALAITDFLELSFATTSQNSHVYKYLIGLPGFETDRSDIVRIDPLVDLVNSFGVASASQLAQDPNISATTLRQNSNFKLKNIKISAVHHLEDWDLSVSYEGRSELSTTGTKNYVFNPYFTLNLAWKQIPEIKSSIAKTPTSLSVK